MNDDDRRYLIKWKPRYDVAKARQMEEKAAQDLKIKPDNIPTAILAILLNPDGSWNSFGKIWTWAKGQEWWEEFIEVWMDCPSDYFRIDMVDVVRFPLNLIDFLREREGQ